MKTKYERQRKDLVNAARKPRLLCKDNFNGNNLKQSGGHNRKRKYILVTIYLIIHLQLINGFLIIQVLFRYFI